MMYTRQNCRKTLLLYERNQSGLNVLTYDSKKNNIDDKIYIPAS